MIHKRQSAWLLIGLIAISFLQAGCLGRMKYSVSREVAAGYKLSRSQYSVPSPMKDFPGREPGKPVGGHYCWNGFLFQKVGCKRAGIYFTEPYDPEKIPVLFIHGLLSDPYTWEKMTTYLAEDQLIRDHYQFWYYAYPTSLPLISSSQVLRQHFTTCVQKVEKEHGVSLEKQVVVVGHSMGGILAKTLISESGDTLWNNSFQTSPEALRISPEHRAFLRDAYFFEPSPYVGRTIFLATPHRGSVKAERGIGKFGMNLAKVPQFMKELVSELSMPENIRHARSGYRDFLCEPANSIASLRQSAPFSRVLAALPIEDGVPYHNIASTMPGETGDGIVKVKNTSLPSLKNHITIKADHNLQKSETAARILSIVLKQHLRHYTPELAKSLIRDIKGLQWVDRVPSG